MSNAMMEIDIYADTTGLYTDEECNYCNCVSVRIPEEIVRAWYYKEIYGYKFADGIENTFDNWIKEEYTCDDTDGLYQFAIENGFVPACGRNCNGWTWY